MTIRFLPLLAIVFFLGTGVVWRSIIQRRRYGTLGFALFSRVGVREVIAMIFGTIAIAAALSQAMLAAFAPEMLRPILITGSDAVRVFGVLIAVHATFAMAFAQLDLGASWRIGIEDGASPGLVTSGFYRVSRNPIFALMLAAILGIGLTVPTWISLALVVLTFAGTHAQILTEERWLQKTYGTDYEHYAARVGRYFTLTLSLL